MVIAIDLASWHVGGIYFLYTDAELSLYKIVPWRLIIIDSY